MSFADFISLVLRLSAAAAFLAGVYALWIIFTRRYNDYRTQYQVYLRQKHRVEDRLKRDRSLLMTSSMRPDQTTIRDFLYLDADRLYSLYSQVSGGVADQIIKSYESAQKRDQEVTGVPLTGRSLEEQVVEASRRTENAILHDHLYSQLETKLEKIIFRPQPLSHENYDVVLRETNIIRITGRGQIEDYGRLQMLIEGFNEIGENLSKFAIKSDENRSRVEVLRKMIKEEHDREAKELYQKILKQLTDATEYAKANNLYLSDDLEFLLSTFTELFADQAIHIVITRAGEEGAVTFRGVMNKSWLRVSPDSLRALYAGATVSDLTMVGQLTYLPKKSIGVSNVDTTSPESEVKDRLPEEGTVKGISAEAESNKVAGIQTSPDLRSGMKQMFSAMGTLDEMFFESKEQIEIAISPIAIYREIRLPETSELKRNPH